MHDIALHKENAYEDLQEKYRHVYFAYEKRTKETLVLQGKVMELKKKVMELEAFKPKKRGESSGVQPHPSIKWGLVPHIP